MYCKYCGKENRDGQKFCKYCGGKMTQVMKAASKTDASGAAQPTSHDIVPTVHCPNCKKENKAGMKFCKFCGSELTYRSENSGVSEKPFINDPVMEESDEIDKIIEEYNEYDQGDEYEHLEDDGTGDKDIELWYEEDTNKLRRKKGNSKKHLPARESRGIHIGNRTLIAIIAFLGVVLIGLVLSLVAYFKTGLFNPLSLFDSNNTVKTAEVENDEDDIAESISADLDKIADAIEVAGNEEKSETDEDAPVETDLFTEFLAGNVKAVVADDFLCSIEWTNEMKSGQEYTLQELQDYVLNDEKMAYESFENPKAYYSTINVHGGIMNALKLSYSLKDNEFSEGLDETYVFYNNNGKLEIIFAIDESNFGTGPSMRGGSVDASGVSNYYAHGGAGESQYSKQYAPDTNFSYKMISDEESHIAFDPAFYDTNNTPMESLNRTMEEAAAQNESAQYVRYYREKINNDVYFYYLNDGEEGLTQSTVDFIDAIAAANGFGFDGKATADAAREAYEKELGVYEICQKYTEPQWNEIK